MSWLVLGLATSTVAASMASIVHRLIHRPPSLFAFDRPVDDSAADRAWNRASRRRARSVHSRGSLPAVPALLTIPHAGYAFSGEIAALAILEALEAAVDRHTSFVVIWFCHRHEDMCTPTTEHSRTQVVGLLRAARRAGHRLSWRTLRHDDVDGISRIRTTEVVLVSTDFSHYNIASAPEVDRATALSTDLATVAALRRGDVATIRALPRHHRPCGAHAVLRALDQHRDAPLDVIAYARSSDRAFVTYVVARVLHDASWSARLHSSALAVAHCAALRDGWITPDELVPAWSPLHHLPGSCFVTVSADDGATLSCFGAWHASTLAEAVRRAHGTIVARSWNGRPIVARLDASHRLSITLIEPRETWRAVTQCEVGQGCFAQSEDGRGATYISSVWDTIPLADDFTTSLVHRKLGADVASLQSYGSVTWEELQTE